MPQPLIPFPKTVPTAKVQAPPSPQGTHNQDQGATDKSWLYSQTRGQLCHWQLPSYCTSSDGGISMPRHNTASALRGVGRGHRHYPAGWGTGLDAKGSQRQKTCPPIDREIYKKNQFHDDQSRTTGTRVQAKCTAAREQVKHALYRHRHTEMQLGFMALGGKQSDKPQLHGHTHAHTPARVGSAHSSGTRQGLGAWTWRVFLIARHGTETQTRSLGTELEEELVSERGRGTPAPARHTGSSRGRLGRSRGLPAVRCAAGGRGEDGGPLCLWLVFLVFLLWGGERKSW